MMTVHHDNAESQGTQLKKGSLPPLEERNNTSATEDGFCTLICSIPLWL